MLSHIKAGYSDDAIRKTSCFPSALAPADTQYCGDDGRTEARISALKSLTEKTLERITVLEVGLTAIKSNYATREDVAKLEGNLLKWFIGTPSQWQPWHSLPRNLLSKIYSCPARLPHNAYSSAD